MARLRSGRTLRCRRHDQASGIHDGLAAGLFGEPGPPLVAGSIADRVFPDPEHELKRIKLRQALQAAVLERTSEIEGAAAEVVKAGAQGQSRLQRTWRPVTMLVFVGLTVAQRLGWSAPNLGEAEVQKMWDIVEIGLGGYVIGRSAEKVLPGMVGTIERIKSLKLFPVRPRRSCGPRPNRFLPLCRQNPHEAMQFTLTKYTDSRRLSQSSMVPYCRSSRS